MSSSSLARFAADVQQHATKLLLRGTFQRTTKNEKALHTKGTSRKPLRRSKSIERESLVGEKGPRQKDLFFHSQKLPHICLSSFCVLEQLEDFFESVCLSLPLSPFLSPFFLFLSLPLSAFFFSLSFSAYAPTMRLLYSNFSHSSPSRAPRKQ